MTTAGGAVAAGGAFDGLANARDLGGLPTRGGGATRPGVLWRSDALAALTDRGLAEFAAAPIGTVFDLRTPAERTAAPNRLPATGVREVPQPMLEGDMSRLVGRAALTLETSDAASSPGGLLDSLPTLDDLYLGLLEHAAAGFAAVASAVATPGDADRPGVLVHCTAGKDRTGVTVALLLAAADVDRDAIVADYTLSAANLAGAWLAGHEARVRASGLPMTDRLRALIAGAPASVIDRALDWVDGRGGARDYLLRAGLVAADVDRLGERLAA